jgi:RES domain-containing protein
MGDFKTLTKIISGLPTISLQGTTYRVIHNKHIASALSTVGSRRGGRYNPPNVFEALYIADNPTNALLEVEALRITDQGLVGVQQKPLVILSLKYQLSVVLDLCDSNHQTAIGTTLEELTTSWRDLNIQRQISTTQHIGMVVHTMGTIQALKVPSAKINGAYNLVVFPDRLLLEKTSFISVYDPDDLIVAKLP